MERAEHVVCMRDGMDRACGLYERWKGQGVVWMRDGKGRA